MQRQNQNTSPDVNPDVTSQSDNSGEPVKFTYEGGSIPFWDDLYDGSKKGLLERHQAYILEKIRTLDKKTTSPKLGANLYGMWLSSNTARLIFCDCTIDSKNILILLECFTGHHYDYSMVHKSQKFKARLEVLKQEIHAKLAERKIASHLPTKVKLLNDENWKPLVLGKKDEIISLDNEQESCSYQPLPMILFGMPGSGKTLILTENLGNRMVMTDADDRKIYVMTERKRLLQDIIKSWKPHAENLGHKDCDCVIFKSGNLNDVLFPADEWVEVGEDNFKEWYKKYLSHLNNLEKSANQQMNEETEYKFLGNTSNYSRIYQELMHISPLTLEEYKGLGDKLCEYAGSEKREWLWKVKEAYKKYLEEKHPVNNNQGSQSGNQKRRKGRNVINTQATSQETRQYFHRGFSAIPESKKNLCKAFYCDEAHNYTTQELVNIALFAGLNIFYVLDNQQDLDSIQSKRPLVEIVIERYLREENQNRIITTRVLSKNYRSGDDALPMFNIISFIDAVFSEAGDRCAYKMMQGTGQKGGNLFWMQSMDGSRNDDDKKLLEFLQKVKDLASFAILADEKDHDEVKKLFGDNALIMTAGEAKGLEYEYVLSWKPCDKEIFRKMGTEVAKMDFTKSVKENKLLIKHENISGEMNFACRGLKIATTRTTRSGYQFF